MQCFILLQQNQCMYLKLVILSTLFVSEWFIVIITTLLLCLLSITIRVPQYRHHISFPNVQD